MVNIFKLLMNNYWVDRQRYRYLIIVIVILHSVVIAPLAIHQSHAVSPPHTSETCSRRAVELVQCLKSSTTSNFIRPWSFVSGWPDTLSLRGQATATLLRTKSASAMPGFFMGLLWKYFYPFDGGVRIDVHRGQQKNMLPHTKSASYPLPRVKNKARLYWALDSPCWAAFSYQW